MAQKRHHSATVTEIRSCRFGFSMNEVEIKPQCVSSAGLEWSAGLVCALYRELSRCCSLGSILSIMHAPHTSPFGCVASERERACEVLFHGRARGLSRYVCCIDVGAMT